MKEETFNMFGSKWTIKYADKIETDDGKGFQFGLTDYINRVICVATKSSNGD